MKGCKGNSGIAPLIRNLGARLRTVSRTCRFNPRIGAPVPRRLGGARAGLDVLGKRESCWLWCFFLNFLNSFSCSGIVPFTYLFLCLDFPGLYHCLYCTVHNTNINAPGRIRTHSLSKGSAADRRFRPLDHLDRQFELWTDWAVPVRGRFSI
jgi:hypothetical protein